jgi:hypothetical protein
MKLEGTTLRQGAVRSAEMLSHAIQRLRSPTPVSVLALFSALVLFRLPNIVLQGRIWAEEGSIYLDASLRRGWYGGLSQVWGDYFNLWANLATTVAAHTFPLEYAPYVTLAFAFVAQALPIVVLVFLGETRFVPVVAALLIATVPMAEEVWLNTINSQVHLLLASGLILALPTPTTRVKRAFCYGVLLITSLSSPASIVMTALLGMRAAFDRSWPRARQAVAIGIGAAVQFFIILAYLRPNRTIGIDPQLLAAVVCLKHILVPFLGASGADKIARLLSLQQVSAAVIAGVVIGWAALLAVLAMADRSTTWLFIFAASIMVFSYAGAYGDKQVMLTHPWHDARYYFAPAAALSVVMIGIATSAAGPVRWVATALVAWTALIGVAAYVSPIRAMAQGPSWRGEIAKWREDPRHPIALWPPGWSLELPSD